MFRLTIGWLIEIVLSKVAALQGERINATAFRGFDTEEFQRMLLSYGCDRYGNETLIYKSGKVIKSPVFMGPCYYQALKHHVTDKIQARADGPKKMTSRQPTRGRSSVKEGGLRIGEMEQTALVSHGAANVIQDRLCLSSDAFKTVYCSTCGQIAVADAENDRLSCQSCGDKANFGNCTIPFPYKLIEQTLGGANIRLSLKFEGIGDDRESITT